MNRLIRIILYITAGCVGIGCAALILSFVLGGGSGWLAGEEMEIARKAADRIHELTAGSKRQVQSDNESGDGSYTYEEADIADGSYTYEETDVAESEGYGDIGMLTVDASSIQDLSIELQHGYLSIEESDDNLIRVSVTESFDGLTAKCESGGIIIRDDRTGNHGREDAQVFLEIPDGMQFQNVNIQIDAGVMYQECGFQSEQLTVNADAGEITLSEVTADALSASVGAGVIDIEDSVFDTASFNCGVGTMDIEADIRGDAQIDCGMGRVDLELEDGANSVNYVLYCGAGSIEIGDNTYSGLAKESRLNNGASATFSLNCGMGSICID